MTETQTPIEYQSAGPRVIVARPDGWYRGKRLIFAIALVLAGPWFAYDGWVKYPAENRVAKERGALTPPYNDLSLFFQRAIAVVLPPLGLFWIARILYTSRGVYRLSGDTLSIPGHPDIPVDAITQIDLQKWDRKGIAVLDYSHAGKAGRFKLDDYLYERKPTDDILDRIKARIAPDEAVAETAEPPTEAEPEPEAVTPAAFPAVPPVKGPRSPRSRPS